MENRKENLKLDPGSPFFSSPLSYSMREAPEILSEKMRERNYQRNRKKKRT